MKETEFKVLMHLGYYVNPNLLEKGIYISNKPFIYEMDETIETLIAKAEKVNDIMGKRHFSDSYFSSLKCCKLVRVKITEVKP
jgi:hypothetical protein